MSRIENLKGLRKEQEIDPQSIWRDNRTAWTKFKQNVNRPETFLTVIAMAVAASVAYPILSEAALALSLGVSMMVKAKESKFRLPLRMPKSSEVLDLGQINPANGLPQKAEGIVFLGNDRETKEEVWLNNSDARTHLVIFGSTGSGKSEALKSIFYNALVQGSGGVYVDGKGDISLYSGVFAMARAMGREDDILVINYMTGGRDVFGPKEKKLSNTLNPFTNGSSGGLVELLVSLMGAGSGGDMWKGRAISLISCLMPALVYMRDNGELLLDAGVISKYLVLEEIVKLYKTRTDFPEYIRTGMKNYLVSIPDFNMDAEKQEGKAPEQFGYQVMYFTKILSSLNDTYGFIFNSNLAEVDFNDIVLNRRILIVLLPGLEKSQDELKNLGGIVVACLKQMMGSGLGSEMEGTKKEILDSRITNSPIPFMCILDEYGYYAVDGTAIAVAQSRSLGFSMIFAGQDIPSFEKGGDKEAASILANCNTKICMKLEDAEKTFDFFNKVADSSISYSNNTLNQVNTLTGTNFVPSQNLNVEKKQRISQQDLREQSEGQAHIFFKSAIIRVNMFYAAATIPNEIGVNYFVKVKDPSQEELNIIKPDTEKYISLFNEVNQSSIFKDTPFQRAINKYKQVKNVSVDDLVYLAELNAVEEFKANGLDYKMTEIYKDYEDVIDIV